VLQAVEETQQLGDELEAGGSRGLVSFMCRTYQFFKPRGASSVLSCTRRSWLGNSLFLPGQTDGAELQAAFGLEDPFPHIAHRLHKCCGKSHQMVLLHMAIAGRCLQML